MASRYIYIANAEQDSRMEAQVGMLLRIGVLSSAAVILLGGVLFLAHHGRSIVDFTVFNGTPPELRRPGTILLRALHGDDLAIIQCGILMLIATPVARVAFSVFVFLEEHDFLYVTISAVVLLILLYSLIWQH
jgi:uncharacterized membrane protein